MRKAGRTAMDDFSLLSFVSSDREREPMRARATETCISLSYL